MKIPTFVLEQRGETSRQFASRKRGELRRLSKALNEFRLGCAYVPGYHEVSNIERSIETLKKAMSKDSWR